MLKKYFKNKDGFTIIETMVAISLFLVVVMYGMTSLLNANAVHRKSQDMRSIIDNLSFIMDDMSKNIRTGYGYHCFISGDSIPSTTSNTMSVPKSCANGWSVAFEPFNGLLSNDGVSDLKDNDQTVYYIALDNSVNPPVGRIWRSTQGPYAAASFVQLTPAEVNIDVAASRFLVLGAEAPTANSQQPFVTIRLVGTITYKSVTTPFSLQTSVSQRLIDL